MIIKENPDKAFVREMRQALRKNNGYCPCALVKNQDSKCKCKNFRDQVERNEPGPCECGLWIAYDEDEGV